MAGYLNSYRNKDSWLSDVREAFSEIDLPRTNLQTVSIKNAFSDLYKLHKEQIKSWWELQSLTNYSTNRIVPKGLRINIRPALRLRTSSLLDKWETLATESSLLFMQLLLEEEALTLNEIERKLDEQTNLVLTFKEHPDFNKKELEFQQNIERYKNWIKEKKHNQYLRDLTEFREKTAYNHLDQPIRNSDTEQSASDREGSDRESQDTEGSRGSGWTSNRGRGRGHRGRSNYRRRGAPAPGNIRISTQPARGRGRGSSKNAPVAPIRELQPISIPASTGQSPNPATSSQPPQLPLPPQPPGYGLRERLEAGRPV